jgi:hypothetical protein
LARTTGSGFKHHILQKTNLKETGSTKMDRFKPIEAPQQV